MDPLDIIRAFSFLFMTTVGILGNSALLAFFSCSAYQEHGLVASEVIILSLTVSNLVVAITRGLPSCLYIFGLPNVLNNGPCQLLVYASRVSRAMSICLTCFLSCFQCVTLKSTSSTYMYVKVRLQIYAGSIIVLLLIMNATMYIAPLLYAVSGINMTNLEYAFQISYCFVIVPDKTYFLSNNFTLFARDLVFVTGMSVASCSILYTLYKHGKQVKGIRSSERPQSLSAETRASKMVSILVALYFLFFAIDNATWFYQSASLKNNQTSISDIRYFFSVCYASVFPFIILLFNRKLMLIFHQCTNNKPCLVEALNATIIAR